MRIVNGFEVYDKEEHPEEWARVLLSIRLPKEERQARDVTLSRRFKVALLIAQRCKCAGCSKFFEATWDCHLDHNLPLALGGTNDVENLQLLCQHCNSTKQAKHPTVWRTK